MSDKKDFFPGFEDDDASKSSPKRPEPAKTPSFDPFAGVQVQAPGTGLASGSSTTPPASPSAGLGVRPAPSAVSRAPAPQPQLPDEDIKPGSRKDLWKCPHCGTGNRPDRDSCRSCGKRVDEPVVIPWQRRPIVWAGLATMLVGIIGVTMWSSRVDLSLREPMVALADRKARIGGSSTGSVELPGGIRLAIDRQISVCGRIAGLSGGPGATRTIALALHPTASEERPVVTATAHGNFSFEDGVGIVLACVFQDPNEAKSLFVGGMLSVSGDTGSLLSGGSYVRDADGMIPVRVTNFLVR